MLRATDQIRDAVRQMSALALCSRHECCWHTHQRSVCGGEGSKRGVSRVSREEKMDGMKKGEERNQRGRRRKTEEGEGMRRVCHRDSDVTSRRLHRWDEIYSVMFLSVSNQSGQESDATSLDIPRAATLTLTDLASTKSPPGLVYKVALVHSENKVSLNVQQIKLRECSLRHRYTKVNI